MPYGAVPEERLNCAVQVESWHRVKGAFPVYRPCNGVQYYWQLCVRIA